MKKAIAGGILMSLVTLILCACLTACKTSFTGTYKFYSIEYEEEGIKLDLKVGDSYMGMITLTEDFMVLTINEDNTLKLSTMGTTVEGTWKESLGEYYITYSDAEQEVKVNGNKITISEQGAKLVLKKVK